MKSRHVAALDLHPGKDGFPGAQSGRTSLLISLISNTGERVGWLHLLNLCYTESSFAHCFVYGPLFRQIFVFDPRKSRYCLHGRYH